MGADDVDDILAAKIARLTQERLLAIVMVICPIGEVPIVAPNRPSGQLGFYGPPGEGRETSLTSTSV